MPISASSSRNFSRLLAIFVLAAIPLAAIPLAAIPVEGGCQVPAARGVQAARPASTRRFAPVARALANAINRGDAGAMQRLFSPRFRQLLPAAKAAPFFAGIVAARGKIERLGTPQLDDGTAYVRLGAARGVWDLQLTLDAQGLISGLLIQPAGPSFAVVPRSAKPLQLPFRGEWTIVWGGATKKQNYHVTSPAQRRAIDCLITDKQGRSCRTSGRSNTDFYAYGRPILAAGTGQIVQIIDGVAENQPGQMNAAQVVGNCVVVQQARGEFAFYAHLQPGSIRVKVGDKITAGQTLGKCGNSGHSSEPHLHFHLQNTPELTDGSGIAPIFAAVQLRRAGRAVPVRDYAPLQGDRVSAIK